jgi:hypothetical protein
MRARALNAAKAKAAAAFRDRLIQGTVKAKGRSGNLRVAPEDIDKELWPYLQFGPNDTVAGPRGEVWCAVRYHPVLPGSAAVSAIRI